VFCGGTEAENEPALTVSIEYVCPIQYGSFVISKCGIKKRGIAKYYIEKAR
jgi:hypothetical protein